MANQFKLVVQMLNRVAEFGGMGLQILFNEGAMRELVGFRGGFEYLSE
jgi:hypothetical protein